MRAGYSELMVAKFNIRIGHIGDCDFISVLRKKKGSIWSDNDQIIVGDLAVC